MPNGKAGDHWYTDVVSHRLPTFNRAIDDLVRELNELAAGSEASAAWNNPKRQQIESTVDAHLDRVGHDALAERGRSVGMDYRNLTLKELASLEAELGRLRQSL